MRRVLSIAALSLVFITPALDAQTRASVRSASTTSRDVAPTSTRIDIADLPYGAYAGSTIRIPAAVRSAGLPAKDGAIGLAWESSDPARAWVTDDGVVSLFKPGRVTLTAIYGKVRARKTIEILENPVRSIRLRGEPQADVRVGVPIRLIATVNGDKGPVVDAHVNYAVVGGRDPAVASVTEDGVFTAREAGVYTVIAEFGGRSDRVTMLLGMPGVTTVAATDEPVNFEIESGAYEPYVGTTIQLSARVVRRSTGAAVKNPRIFWRSSDSDVAWVGQDGTVVFEGPGRVTITAEHGKATTSRTFIVMENPARQLVLDTNARGVRTLDTLKVRADVWTFGGQAVRRARVNYGVVAHTAGTSDGAAVLEGGRFVAKKPGLYTIIAELGGVADTQVIMVQPRATSDRDKSDDR